MSAPNAPTSFSSATSVTRSQYYQNTSSTIILIDHTEPEVKRAPNDKDQRFPMPEPRRIGRRTVLGGLIKEYRQAA
jgi:hypothetical protein